MKNIAVILSLVLGMVCFIQAQPDILIERDDVPFVIGQWAIFDQNSDVFQWDPFDSLRLWWDLTDYPGGLTARVHLLDPSQGLSPAPDTFPNAEILELDTLGTGDIVWTYLSDTTFYFYVQGIDYETGGFRFIGNYLPDYQCYVYPIYDEAGWNTAWTWSYEVYPSIVYNANESHQKSIVAKGKVKVPFSGGHFWPCLVIRDYMEYSDNFGTWDTRWIYEWIVPGRFAGGNGVAAAQSTNGGSQNFMLVDHFFKMTDLYVPNWDLHCPDFANTTIWPDTAFAGPYVVSSMITDSTGIGADSLFYNLNSGSFIGVGHDSIVGDTYYFTIPGVGQACTLGYFIWAEDSFSVLNGVDIWNTDPICAPESTYYVFAVFPGIEEADQDMISSDRIDYFPNPFTANLHIRLWLLGGQNQCLRIFDNSGRCVRTLLDTGCSRSDIVNLEWNGMDDQGRRLASGIYFIEYRSGHTRTVDQVLYIK
jgi:hypothetical protein